MSLLQFLVAKPHGGGDTPEPKQNRKIFEYHIRKPWNPKPSGYIHPHPAKSDITPRSSVGQQPYPRRIRYRLLPTIRAAPATLHQFGISANSKIPKIAEYTMRM